MSWRTKAKHLSRSVAISRSIRLYGIYLNKVLAYMRTAPLHYV